LVKVPRSRNTSPARRANSAGVSLALRSNPERPSTSDSSSQTSDYFSDPVGAAFDSSGDPVPAVTISGDSISGPYMAFDPAGDMWVPNWSSSTMVEFAKSQLARSGDPVPVRTVSGEKTEMGSPTYLLVEP
jgi:hypothetical protein